MIRTNDIINILFNENKEFDEEGSSEKEIISRLEDLNIIKDFITNIVINVPLDVTIVIVFMILLFNNNKKIFVLLMVFNLLIFVTQIFTTKILKKRLKQNRLLQDKVNTSFLDGLNKENTIKNLHIETKIINKFYKVYEKYLGGVLPHDNNNVVKVFGEKFAYKSLEKYQDGYKCIKA